MLVTSTPVTAGATWMLPSTLWSESSASSRPAMSTDASKPRTGSATFSIVPPLSVSAPEFTAIPAVVQSTPPEPAPPEPAPWTQ